MSHKNKNQLGNDRIDDDSDIISKTQKKQMAHELQDLAKAITDMPKKKIAQLQLPDAFLDAIEESKRINSHIAKKRHFQYMGKVLLKTDHQAIKAKIDQLQNLDGHYQIRDAIINLWIEQFVNDEKPLIDYLYQHHNHEEMSNLRQILRNHLKDAAHPANRKKLFQVLRELDQNNELPNPMVLT